MVFLTIFYSGLSRRRSVKRRRGKKEKQKRRLGKVAVRGMNVNGLQCHTPLSSYLFVMLHRNNDPGDLFVTATQFKTHSSSAAAAAVARRPSSSFVIQKSCTPFARNVMLGVFDHQPQS